jgi:hypothetical protein
MRGLGNQDNNPGRQVKAPIAAILGYFHILSTFGGLKDNIHLTGIVYEGIRCPA